MTDFGTLASLVTPGFRMMVDLHAETVDHVVTYDGQTCLTFASGEFIYLRETDVVFAER